MPNNRELAVLVWVGVALIWMLAQRSTRKSAGLVLGSLSTPKIAVPLVLLCAYATALVFGLWSAHVWDTELATTTVFWFVGTALALFLAFDEATEDPHFFRRRVRRAASLSVLVGFVAGLRNFGIVVELTAVPVLVILGGMLAVAEHKEEYRQLRGGLRWCIGAAGLTALIYGLLGIAKDPNGYLNASTARSLAVPAMLTCCLLPSVYALTVYGSLDGVLTRLRLQLREQPDIYRYARRRIVLSTRLRLRNALRASRAPLRLMLPSPSSRVDVDRLIAHLRSKQPHVLAVSPAEEQAIREITRDEDPGWEYLLFAARLDAGAEAVARGGGPIDAERRFDPALSPRKALRRIRKDNEAAAELVSRIGQVFDESRVEDAFGAPGEPGDPNDIVRLAEDLLAQYDAMLLWRQRARAAHAEGLDELLRIHAEFLDRPIQQVEDYIDRWVEFASRLPDLLRDAENAAEPIQIDMALVITADEDVIARFTALTSALSQAA